MVGEQKKTPHRTEGTWNVNAPLPKPASAPRRQADSGLGKQEGTSAHPRYSAAFRRKRANSRGTSAYFPQSPGALPGARAPLSLLMQADKDIKIRVRGNPGKSPAQPGPLT